MPRLISSGQLVKISSILDEDVQYRLHGSFKKHGHYFILSNLRTSRWYKMPLIGYHEIKVKKYNKTLDAL